MTTAAVLRAAAGPRSRPRFVHLRRSQASGVGPHAHRQLAGVGHHRGKGGRQAVARLPARRLELQRAGRSQRARPGRAALLSAKVGARLETLQVILGRCWESHDAP